MKFPFRLFAFWLLSFLAVSCGEKQDIPSSEKAISSDSIISGDKMVHILADVHIAEAAMLVDRNEGQEVSGRPDFLYQGIFKKHHISRARYDENLRFYSQNPAKMIKMYEKVIAEIETRESKFHPSK